MDYEIGSLGSIQARLLSGRLNSIPACSPGTGNKIGKNDQKIVRVSKGNVGGDSHSSCHFSLTSFQSYKASALCGSDFGLVSSSALKSR